MYMAANSTVTCNVVHPVYVFIVSVRIAWSSTETCTAPPVDWFWNELHVLSLSPPGPLGRVSSSNQGFGLMA